MCFLPCPARTVSAVSRGLRCLIAFTCAWAVCGNDAELCDAYHPYRNSRHIRRRYTVFAHRYISCAGMVCCNAVWFASDRGQKMRIVPVCAARIVWRFSAPLPCISRICTPWFSPGVCRPRAAFRRPAAPRLLYGVQKLRHAVFLFPGQMNIRAAKMAVGGNLAVHGAAQVKRADDAGRA